MDFYIPEATRELVARVGEFVDTRLIPLEEGFLAHGFASVEPALIELRRDLQELRLWAPPHAREFGGMGLDELSYAHVSEELGRCPLGHFAFGCQAPDAGNIELLGRFANAPQKRRWLPPLVQGELRSCFAMTERSTSGANPVLLSTTAALDGDEFVIDGEKWFATGADGAALCIVMAVTDPGAEPHRRASLFLVPLDTPGISLQRNTPVMGHAGSNWHSHGELVLERCRVPAANLLGERGAGFRMAQARLGQGRIQHCTRWMGICRRALDLMIAHSRQRIIDARGRTLADSDLVRTWIGESAAQIHAARLAVLHCAWKLQVAGSRAARDEISMIKFTCATVLQRVVDRAIQVHGALGVSDYTILGYFHREERAARIYDGPDEVHKLAVAKHLLEGK